MVDVRCRDGRVLGLVPVPVLGRDGVPYELVLHLAVDGRDAGVVGERCHGVLTGLLARGTTSALEAGVRAAGGDWPALAPYLPRDRELLALRARDPDDLPGGAALRAVLDVRRTWSGGRWEAAAQVRLEAWAEDGTGVLADLAPQALLDLAARLLQEGERAASG